MQENSQKTEKVEDNKKEAEAYSLKGFMDLMQTFGTLKDVEYREHNGAWRLLYTDNITKDTYVIASPAARWKRTLDEQGNVVARESGDHTAMLSEISVLLLRPQTDERNKNKEAVISEDKSLIEEHLNTVIAGGHTQGMEIEYLIKEIQEDSDESEILRPWQAFLKEAFRGMRETDTGNPARSLEELSAKIEQQLELIFKESFGYIISISGMWPEDTKPGEAGLHTLGERDIKPVKEMGGDPSAIGYVHAMVETLTERLMTHLDTAGESEIHKWAQVASRFGAGNSTMSSKDKVRAFIQDVGFNMWTATSFHHSIGIPQYKNGFVPEIVPRNISNAHLYFSPLIDANNYSGGMAFGVPLVDEETGKVVLDARTRTAGILSSSLPADMIKPSALGDRENLFDIQLECFLSGRANTLDRCTGEVSSWNGENGQKIKTKFAPIHSLLRSRTSAPLTAFISYLKKLRKNPATATLQTAARVEYTGRSATPDILGGNMYSIALQNITHLAGELAAVEGKDIVEWMIENDVITDKSLEEVYGANKTGDINARRQDATRGRFDRELVSQMQKLINTVEEHIRTHPDVVVSKHQEQVLEYAHHALRNIRRLQVLVSDTLPKRRQKMAYAIRESVSKKTATEKYDYFVENELGIAGLISWQNDAHEFVISDADILEILKERFPQSQNIIFKDTEGKPYTVNEITDRGYLEMILGHYHLGTASTQKA